jgi:hypothetical protein
MTNDCRNRLTSRAAWLVAAVAIGGCAGHPSPGGDSSAGPAAGPDVTSAWSLVKAFSAAGLPALNPRDVTSRRCVEVHCAGAVATDTVSVLIFGRSRDAQLYEASLSNGYQIGDVVLEFAPTIDAAQRTAYERIVARAVG